MINFLQCQVCRFGIAEIDQWYKGKIQAHEYQIAFPLEIGNEGWRDHYDKEVPRPVARNTNGRTFGAGVEAGEIFSQRYQAVYARGVKTYGRISGT